MAVHKKLCTEIIAPCDSLMGEGSCDVYVDECLFCSTEPYTATVTAAYVLTGIILLIALVSARWRIRKMKRRIQQQINIEVAK